MAVNKTPVLKRCRSLDLDPTYLGYTKKSNRKSARAGKKKNTKKVDMPAKLFDELAPKYANRNGGYSRIVKIGQRKGDGAMEVLLELV